MPFSVAKDAGDFYTYNIHHGFPEGLVRGYRSGFLADSVSNLVLRRGHIVVLINASIYCGCALFYISIALVDLFIHSQRFLKAQTFSETKRTKPRKRGNNLSTPEAAGRPGSQYVAACECSCLRCCYV